MKLNLSSTTQQILETSYTLAALSN